MSPKRKTTLLQLTWSKASIRRQRSCINRWKSYLENLKFTFLTRCLQELTNESLARLMRKTNQFGKSLKTEKRTRIGRTTYLMVNMVAGTKVVAKPLLKCKSNRFCRSCKGWLSNSDNNIEESGGALPKAGQIWGCRNTWGLCSQVAFFVMLVCFEKKME